MGSTVFANGMAVSGKASDHKTMAKMPDVCMSPPSPPAGPVPIPYPNFSQASDTTGGSKKVKIGGKEVSLKGKSTYKKSKGDEAATRNFGASVVSAKIQGAIEHQAGSFDVKVEGKNVVRFLDLTTGNNGSPGLPPGPEVSKASPFVIKDPECQALQNELDKAEKNDTNTGSVDKNQVLTTAKYSKKAGIMKAASENMMRDNIDPLKKDGYLKRPSRPSGKEPKIACTDKSFSEWTKNSGHTEGKAIQNVFSQAAPGGTLTLRIKWNNKGAIKDEPCGSCKNAICQAAQECDLKVELCLEKPGTNEVEKKEAPCKTSGPKSKTPGKHRWDGSAL